MFKVKKGNRVLTVNETEKSYYLSEGYDVVELNEETKVYEVAEKATGGRTYSVAEYNAVADELEKVKADFEEHKSKAIVEKFDRKEAMATLKEKNVPFNATDKNDVLKKLLEENA